MSAELNPQFETLKEIGNYGLSEGISFTILEIDYGEGYDDSALIGSDQGTRNWRLVFKSLLGTLDYPVQLNSGDLQSRADYIWDFFCRHKAAGNKSFRMVSPRDGKVYLAKFLEHTLTYEMFAIKLFSTGLVIQQRRERGVNESEDRSIGSVENPDQI
jgi:hypothetical protein